MNLDAVVQSRIEASPSGNSWATTGVALALPFVAVTGVAAASGGFNATSFGWTALAFVWAVVVAVTISAAVWGKLDVCWLVAASAGGFYAFASTAWTESVADAVNAGFRWLVYLTGIALALLVARRGRLNLWLGGLVFGATAVCGYAVTTRLFPDRFGAFNADAGYRLFVPIGYWNALGIFAALASLLAVGVASLGRIRWIQIISGAALVPLTATMYFTFSRGAWLALALGLVATFALSPHRVRLLIGILFLAPIPAVGVLLESRAGALTHQATAMGVAAHAGHRLAIELAVLFVAQAIAGAAYTVWAPRVRISDTVRRTAGVIAIAVVVLGSVAVVAAYGSPIAIARHGYDSFVSAPPGGADLNGRLFSLSNNGRTVLWHSALDDFRAHPLVGSGAGSFSRWWLEHRATSYFVQDAHNLYLQTLAEGGVIGLAIILVLLSVPLVAAVRARDHPLVAPAFGAYVAYLVHAAIDWDWQMPAVTLLALFVGAAMVAAARGKPIVLLGRLPYRIALVSAGAVVAAIAFVGLIGNLALARAQNAILNGYGQSAIVDATRAHRWAPWSGPALKALGESRVLAGDRLGGLDALHRAAAKDPTDWQTWFDIAAVTTGAAQREALARARLLNPVGPELAIAGR